MFYNFGIADIIPLIYSGLVIIAFKIMDANEPNPRIETPSFLADPLLFPI